MKFGFKAAFFCLMLIVTACLFSGCAWMDSSFQIELTDANHENVYVDVLLPFDTDDKFYTDYNENADNTTMPVLDKNCELAAYNEDGYRSMFVHYSGAGLYQSVLNDNSIIRTIHLPKVLYELDDTPYGEEAFMDFCRKYKKCRFAAFDNKGHILCVSKNVKLKKFPDYYINDTTEWDIAKNKIKPHYIISADYLIIRAMMWLCAVACLILQLILNAIYNRMYRKGNRRCLTILILSGICTVVTVIASLVLIMVPIISTTFKFEPSDLLELLLLIPIFALPFISLFVNIKTFKNFITDMEIFKKSDTIE